MYKLISIFSFMLIYVSVAFGQAEITIPLAANDGSVPAPGIALAVGLDVTATDGIDGALGEAALPPLAPGLDVRFEIPSGQTTYFDFRAPGTGYPFTGLIQHVIVLQASAPGLDINIEYDLPAGAVLTITDQIGGTFLDIGPFTNAGVAVIPSTYLAIFGSAFFNMDYTNIEPPSANPDFEFDVTSLDFGPVAVGNPAVLPVIVSNVGDAPLDITGIVSSDPQYVVDPNPPTTFPITIGIGGTYAFDVTFTPTALGTFPATIEFASNAPTSPDVLNVTGAGADAGPTFAVDPTSLTFPTVFVGNSADLILTVSNNGLTNTLNITNVTTTNGDYSVLPTSATVAPGASEVFTVTFAPSGDGTIAGDVVFDHDGPGPTTSVPVTGVGFTPPTVSGLVFSEDTAFVPENTYDLTATLQLLGLPPGDAVHALQFKLQSNMVVDDETILTFQSITKSGSIASDPDWVLETNVVRGPIEPNGASEDLIYCLLYHIGDGALTGDWTNLMQVTYKTAVLPPLTPTQKSSFNLIDVEGSNVAGNAIPIVVPSDPTLEVIVEAAGGTYGDVNGDGCVDILDLIMVVDHIVGRDSLTGAEFDRADLAPWPGTPEPAPDGFVNVQDLSVIQSIILTGFYPNGDPVTPCGYLAKVEGPANATVTLYINSEGISAYVDADVGIRGAQIEFTSVSENPENLVINTPLGQGYYDLSEGLFRTLMYDRAGQKYIDAGVNNFMADMPFALANSQDVEIAKIVLVDNDVKKIGNIVVQTIYGTTALPLDYILFQNYPNPFNPTTAVKFQVPKTSDVKIAVYDMLGQEVRTLFAGEVVRGTYTVDWNGFSNDGSKVASGTYIYRMTAGEFIQSKKMVLIK